MPAPSAESANDLHRPSGASPCWENSVNTIGVDITVTPPTSASEHSPARSDWAARCSATSDDEHAVSTLTAGPSSPNVYATRPDVTLVAQPVSRCPSSPSASACSPAVYPDEAVPANTPAGVPRSVAGSIPASSKASQHASKSSRCCGSIASASRGLIPKNPASNPAASARNPPALTYDVPA